jgi:hypothetical protein
MNTTPIYADYLKGSLVRAGMNEGQITSILRKFELMNDKTRNPGLSFVTLHGAYASEDTAAAALTVKAIIQKELGKLAGEPGPEKRPLHRLKAAIERFNKALKKTCVLIDGKEALSEQEVEAVRIALPKCLEPRQSQAVASVANLRSKMQNLEVEVKQ